MDQDILWRESRGIGFIWEEGISAGEYRAQYEDQNGVFLSGTGRPIWQNMLGSSGKEWKETTSSDRNYKQGGIWVPKDSKLKAKIFTIFEVNPQVNKDVANTSSNIALNQMNNGAGVGTSAVGGAIGGAIVSALIKADEGKIFFLPEIKDQNLLLKLKSVSNCRQTANSNLP